MKLNEYIDEEYVSSFDGIFNGTLSYRKDSFIKHNHYGKASKSECNVKKSAHIQFENDKWEDVKESAISKPR